MTRQTSFPRFVLTTFLGIGAVVGLLVGVSYWAAAPKQPLLAGIVSAELAPGRRLSVIQTTVGTGHVWNVPLERTLIEAWTAKSKPRPLEVHSNAPQLLVWLAVHDGMTPHPQVWRELRNIRLIAGGQVVYGETLSTINHDKVISAAKISSGSSVNNWQMPLHESHPSVDPSSRVASMIYVVHFPLIPKGTSPLRLEFLGKRPAPESPAPILATVEILEPGGLNAKPAWAAQPLPATSTVTPPIESPPDPAGEKSEVAAVQRTHTLTLKALRGGGYSSHGDDPSAKRFSFQPEVSLTTDGEAVPTKLYKSGPMTDAAGNEFAGGYNDRPLLAFGPQRLRLTARLPTAKSLAETSRGEVTVAEMPEAGKVARLKQTLALRQGRIQIRLVEAGGAGKVEHPDQTPLESIQWGYYGGFDNLSFRANRNQANPSGGMSSPRRLEIEFNGWHCVYVAEGLRPDERLEVTKVVDDQGRTMKFHSLEHHGTRLAFALPEADAKSLQLTFEVFDTGEFEFFVEPPVPPEQPK